MMTRSTLLFVSLLLWTGCQSSGEDATKPERPRVKVNLPASPEMVEPQIVEKYVDGTYTVAGLIRNRGSLFNTEVNLKGFIQSVQRCAPGEAGCNLPSHAVIVDDLAHPRKRLLVVGGPLSIFGELQESASVTLAGTYRQTDTAGDFVRMEGLLVLEDGPVEPETVPGQDDLAPEESPADEDAPAVE
jgi:hypothetical protein